MSVMMTAVVVIGSAGAGLGVHDGRGVRATRSTRLWGFGARQLVRSSGDRLLVRLEEGTEKGVLEGLQQEMKGESSRM